MDARSIMPDNMIFGVGGPVCDMPEYPLSQLALRLQLVCATVHETFLLL